jgi:hypothetical protein
MEEIERAGNVAVFDRWRRQDFPTKGIMDDGMVDVVGSHVLNAPTGDPLMQEERNWRNRRALERVKRPGWGERKYHEAVEKGLYISANCVTCRRWLIVKTIWRAMRPCQGKRHITYPREDFISSEVKTSWPYPNDDQTGKAAISLCPKTRFVSDDRGGSIDFVKDALEPSQGSGSFGDGVQQDNPPEPLWMNPTIVLA